MTFTGGSLSAGGEIYSEDGITVTSVSGLPFFGFDNGDLGIYANGTTAYAGDVSFSMAKRFNVLGFDIDPFVRASCLGVCDALIYETVSITGYRDGSIVASSEITGFGDYVSFHPGVGFMNLDFLIIGLNRVPISCPVPCVQANLDNVRLSVIPLPAAVPLFGTGIFLLGWFVHWWGRRRGRDEKEIL
ncbi:hypothetical protein GCM10007924_12790 [Sneathiella chinensis]|uniref:Uncharacterized protein n=2 Tax=Sneathiella chinensis TaxID=349750 RepID=A0ABQ5U2U6_9PROT|nr:hypothetical protein GCM10007924_12790 [Sneathiella chinensis]